MHVAYIHQHFSTRKGATGTRSYEMSRRLIESGHRVTMICGVNPATAGVLNVTERVSELDIDGIRVVCIAQKYANEMGFVQRGLAFRNFMNAAGRVVGRLDADLVFATSTPLTVGIPGMRGAKRLGVPLVFEVRDLWPEVPIAIGVVRHPLLKWYLKRLERKIYYKSTRIIGLSPGIVDGICRTGYPRDRVSMIPNCSDLDLFQPSDEPLDDPEFGAPDDFRLIFTGAHGLANGLDAVLDAAAVLKRRGVTGVKFIFIGQGNQKERLVQRSVDEGLQDYTLWKAFVPKEQLAQLLPKMDVGLMILRNLPEFYYGTSPNKFFDYIACGLPILNNYPGWLADMIGEHQLGRVVQPDDPEAFADAVLALRDMGRDERQTIGRRARELAEREFDRNHHAARFVDVLENAHREGRWTLR